MMVQKLYHILETDGGPSPMALAKELMLKAYKFKSCSSYRAGLNLSNSVRPCLKVKLTVKTQ